MLLAAAIIVLIVTLGGFVLTVFGDMMSDAPGTAISPWPWLIGGLSLSAALFVAWWRWGGHAVTW